MLAGLGAQKYLNNMQDEQEFLMAVADLVIMVYAWESALLRAKKLYARGGGDAAEAAADLARLFGDWAAERLEVTARRTLAGLESGDTLQVQLALIRRLLRYAPVDTVSLGRRVASRVLEGGGNWHAIVAAGA